MSCGFIILWLIVAGPRAAVGPPPGPLTRGPEDHARVALTFDACPAAGVNDVILACLREHRPATFFLSGRWIQRFDSEARHLAARPEFELENHSLTHADMRTISDSAIIAEIQRTNNLVARVAGRTCRYFRFPAGTYNTRALAAVRRAGLTPVQWDVVGGDASGTASAKTLVRRVLNQARNGSIVVLHLNKRCRYTATAIPLIIDGLEARGFHLVTLDELLAPSFRRDTRTADAIRRSQ